MCNLPALVFQISNKFIYLQLMVDGVRGRRTGHVANHVEVESKHVPEPVQTPHLLMEELVVQEHFQRQEVAICIHVQVKLAVK